MRWPNRRGGDVPHVDVEECQCGSRHRQRVEDGHDRGADAVSRRGDLRRVRCHCPEDFPVEYQVAKPLGCGRRRRDYPSGGRRREWGRDFGRGLDWFRDFAHGLDAERNDCRGGYHCGSRGRGRRSSEGIAARTIVGRGVA